MKYDFDFILLYLILNIIFVSCGYIYYRVFIKRVYLIKKKLTFLIGFSQNIIFLIHVLLLYLPYYLFSSLPNLKTGKIIILGIFVFIIGFSILIWGFINLQSIFRINGIKSDRLILKGIYKYTRNPQIIGYGLLIISYAIMWPSWYIIVSIISYIIISHNMILSEEKHLRKLFGEEYEKYCMKTPRYF
jgi:protein-S-isoprenylcysteine O-methyltransferase Ste14